MELLHPDALNFLMNCTKICRSMTNVTPLTSVYHVPMKWQCHYYCRFSNIKFTSKCILGKVISLVNFNLLEATWKKLPICLKSLVNIQDWYPLHATCHIIQLLPSYGSSVNCYMCYNNGAVTSLWCSL